MVGLVCKKSGIEVGPDLKQVFSRLTNEGQVRKEALDILKKE